MSSNFDSLFFERYIRGECSESERVSFESALEKSAELRESFEKAQSYFDTLKYVTPVQPSDQFTDNVIRQIRIRAEGRKQGFPALFNGLFSREVIGVVTTVLVLAVLFRSQMSSVLHQIEPVTEMGRSVSMAEPEMKKESQSMALDEAVLPEQSAKGAAEVQSEPSAEVPTAQRNAVSTTGSLAAASDDEIGAAPQKVQAFAAAAPAVEMKKSMPAEAEIMKDQMEEAPAVYRSNEAKEVSVQSRSKGVVCEETYAPKMEQIASEKADEVQSLTKAKKDSAGFPFAHYGATVQYGDTIRVTVPTKNLRTFVKAWKESGGTVIDTVIADSVATVRVLQKR